jgi:hypothetical protein
MTKSLIESVEMHTTDKTIIAASPMFKDDHTVPHRIVIRDIPGEVIVHTQCFHENGTVSYCWGHYLPYANKDRRSALIKAWECFERLVRAKLALPDLGKQCKEVADIAETIIKSLLPEDRDDQADLWEDYQFESDVETFENLTGKKIRPN